MMQTGQGKESLMYTKSALSAPNEELEEYWHLRRLVIANKETSKGPKQQIQLDFEWPLTLYMINNYLTTKIFRNKLRRNLETHIIIPTPLLFL